MLAQTCDNIGSGNGLHKNLIPIMYSKIKLSYKVD